MQRSLLNLLIDLTAAALFVAMISTGYILAFPLPPGTNKVLSLWGLARHQWGEVHFWLSTALLAVLLLHLTLHWQWVVTVIARQLHLATSAQRSSVRAGLVTGLMMGVAFLGLAAAAHRSVREREEPCCTENKVEFVTQTLPATAARRATAPVTTAGIDFWKAVYPIFDSSCVSCHGPNRARGGFRADRPEDFFRAGHDKPLVIPGDSKNSPLVAILAGLRQDIPMADRHQLPEKELSVVKAWIDAGAAWPDRVEEKQDLLHGK